GPYGSAASHEAYRRLIAEWLERRGRFTPPAEGESAPLTVNELILAYHKHAEAYYGFGADPGRGDAYCLRDALRVVRSLYGRSPAREFGPKALKACRARMVAMGWARTYANAQVDRVRRMFRWGAEEELVPAEAYFALKAVSGLRAGKCAA